MNIFENKHIDPMLIGADDEPFDAPDYIYELKLDGERCIAYLDPKKGTELRNKRQVKMLPKVPELAEIHKYVKHRCILDGELFILVDGKPDFSEIQRRSLMSNAFRIELASRQYPASFVAFDILYYKDNTVMDKPLTERKKLLQQVVKAENDRFAMSRYLDGQGVALYHLAEQQGLEGIVAKRKDSLYIQGKRTKEWIKIKNMQDDDYVVCGWIPKDDHMTSIVLGQYRDGKLVYKGHVTLGVGGAAFAKVREMRRIPSPYFSPPPGHGNEDAIWIEPTLVCTVEYMHKTANGGLRQPVFKGLREDKESQNCIDNG